MSIGWVFSIKVLNDNLLFLQNSSNWKSMIFLKSTDFSLSAENDEKHNCYCYFVDVQYHKIVTLSCNNTVRVLVYQNFSWPKYFEKIQIIESNREIETWVLPARSQLTPFCAVKKFFGNLLWWFQTVNSALFLQKERTAAVLQVACYMEHLLLDLLPKIQIIQLHGWLSKLVLSNLQVILHSW